MAGAFAGAAVGAASDVTWLRHEGWRLFTSYLMWDIYARLGVSWPISAQELHVEVEVEVVPVVLVVLDIGLVMVEVPYIM